MKVIWLRKQWGQAYGEYKALRPYLDALWRIKAGVNNLLYYSRDNQKTINALNEIDRLSGLLSRAIREGDYDWARKLIDQILNLRHQLEPPADRSLQEGYTQYVLYLSDAIFELWSLLDRREVPKQAPSQT